MSRAFRFLVAGFVLALVAGFLLGLHSKNVDPPASIDEPCPGTPNCVTSLDTGLIAPISFTGDSRAAWVLFLSVLESEASELVSMGDSEAHAVFDSGLFGFRDDVHVRLDPAASVIHVRSSSRVGHSDMGVNRARIEALREAFGER